jgi:hypothetical protein
MMSEPFGRNDRRNERVARERAFLQSSKLRSIVLKRERACKVYGGISAKPFFCAVAIGDADRVASSNANMQTQETNRMRNPEPT